MALCPQCGTEFGPTRAWHRFCSTQCKNNWHLAERREAVADYRKRQALSLEEQCEVENEEIQSSLGVEWEDEEPKRKRA